MTKAKTKKTIFHQVKILWLFKIKLPITSNPSKVACRKEVVTVLKTNASLLNFIRKSSPKTDIVPTNDRNKLK